MARDNYEVYYYQYGRWSLHASFGSDDRDLAVAEGISVEASLGLPARVIREKLDTQSNTLAEAVVWQGAKAATIADSDNMFGVKQPNAKPAEKRAPSQLPPKQRPEKKATPPPRPITAAPAKVKKKKKKGRGVFMKIIFAFFMSAAIATIGAAVVALSIISLQAMDMIEVANRTPLIFGTFVMLFFISLLYLLNKQLRLLRTLVKSAEPAPAATAMQSPMMRSAAKRAPDQDIEFDNVEIERGEEEAAENPDDAMPPELDADMDAPPEIEAVNEPAPAAQQAAHPAQQQAAPSAAAPAPMPSPAQQQAVPKPEPKQIREKQNPESTAAEIEARQIFANFVNQAIDGVSKKVGELNTFSRFGLSLLLAGAASTLGQAKRLAREPQLAILKQGLGAAANPLIAHQLSVQNFRAMARTSATRA